MSNYANKPSLHDLTGIARALADPSRVRALIALRDNELCVCQLTELLGLAASSVSRHLALLSQCSLLDSRKEGRWVYYRRAGADAPPAAIAALNWVDSAMADSADALADRKKLETILACPVEELCRPAARES